MGSRSCAHHDRSGAQRHREICHQREIWCYEVKNMIAELDIEKPKPENAKLVEPDDQVSPVGPFKIQTMKLNAWYGRNHALKDISIDFREKEVTAIIGP